MNYVEEFEQWVEDNPDLIGVSGGRFRDTTGREGGVIKKNTTPKKYCEDMATHHGCTAEDYAKELMAMNHAIARGEGKLMVGECTVCCTFLHEGDEPHVCTPEAIEAHEKRQKYFEDVLNKVKI